MENKEEKTKKKLYLKEKNCKEKEQTKGKKNENQLLQQADQ